MLPAGCRKLVLGLTAFTVLLLQLCWAQNGGNSREEATQPASTADIATRLAVAPVDAGRYVIGPNDILAIDVWKESELTRVVPVRPDGQISLPLIGEVQASGLTPRELQASLTDKLHAYFERPAVTVIVQQANSHHVNVLGEVQKPGAYVITQPMTVLDALALAGGFRDFAKQKKIYVLRIRADGSCERLPFNYRDVIRGNKIAQNIQLRPGDTVVIP